MNWQLLKLGLVFMMLSVLAVGGGTAVRTDMQHATVHWFNLTDKQFRDIYSIGRAQRVPTCSWYCSSAIVWWGLWEQWWWESHSFCRIAP